MAFGRLWSERGGWQAECRWKRLRRLGLRGVDEWGLEDSEAIFVIREVAAETERPVLLFSGGKDPTITSLDGDGVLLAECAFNVARPGEEILKQRVSLMSERGGRADDRESAAAMEDRKKEGYF